MSAGDILSEEEYARLTTLMLRGVAWDSDTGRSVVEKIRTHDKALRDLNKQLRDELLRRPEE